MRKPYPTDSSDAEWNYIEPHMPPPLGRGRPRIHSLREILDAIFYVLRSGCQWRLLPHDFLQPEAAYLAEIEGARGGYFVNIDGASQMPAIFEPFFLGLGATVQIHPVFIPDDMPRVTEAKEQAVQKYG